MNKFSIRLRDLRIEKKLKQKDVADAIGVTVRAISNYEAGIREPSFDVLLTLCSYFDVSADYLLGRTDY